MLCAVLSHFSHVSLFEILWTIALHAPLSMGFSQQEHYNGLPFPSPGNLPNPGIEPGSPALQAEALPSERAGKPRLDIDSIKKQSLDLNTVLAPKLVV